MDDLLAYWKYLVGTVTALVGSGIAMFKFLNRFQTKADCTAAHDAHDKLIVSRDETRAEEKKHFQTKLDDIHEDVKDLATSQKAFVKKITKDFYAPRVHNSRSSDG